MINPMRFYSHEPAPMGIADFGVTGTGAGASGYEYSTSSFQGTASVGSLAVSISGSSSKVTAFELNAVVVLERNGTNYSYWIQNGLHLDAGSDQFTIGGAYVWNFSAPGATLHTGELLGHAGSTLSSDTYYYIPACGPTYPGQCSTLSLPATVTGRIVTGESGGLPYVTYEYNLGAGWISYDNVSFAHMANATDSGFRVDGYSPTPYSAGLFYDAEWVWVGAGGGSASTDQGSSINLTLASWNGHNYQSIPTAWNFGSNTGETSSNVTEQPSRSLGAHVASGSGSLGVLYNLTEAGFLNLTAPTTGNATLLVEGETVPFQLGSANVTLPVGAHSVYLENYSNASANFTVAAGATTSVDLSGAGEVVVNETGLPAGTSWGLSVDGATKSSSVPALAVNLPNGTYPVGYTSVSGYVLVGASPSFLTLPGPAHVALQFAPFTFEVNVTESGLPASTSWWINVSGVTVQGPGPTLAVMAPNGSTPFEAGSSYEFLANPATGTINVSAGVASPVTVVFSYRPTHIVGTVSPANASVSIGGISQALAEGRFSDSVIPGRYELVASAAGYETARLNVTATPGNDSWENLTLVANQTGSPGTPGASPAASGVPLLTALLLVVGVAVVAIVAVAVLARRRR